MPKLNLAGAQFGKLTVIEEGPRKGRRICWLCRCDCGNTALVMSCNLTTGHTTSCGCVQRRRAVEANTIHGGSVGGSISTEYSIYRNMKARCLIPTNPAYYKYGGRGITICDRWLSDYSAFLSDMGPRPSPKHSIDRIDNDGPYSPANCRWATAKEQADNRGPYGQHKRRGVTDPSPKSR